MTLGPTVAGRWYPSERRDLEHQIDSLLESCADGGGTDRLRALIAPHAAFIYSGSVAASAFRSLDSQAAVKRVILLGPSHYAAFEGAALTTAARYRTPLGEVALDTEAARELSAAAGFRVDDEPFRPEHSLEAEIPFLQRLLRPGWKLLPVLIGAGSSPAGLERVADSLVRHWGADSLAVVSSDFTHYGASFRFVPFHDRVPERIEALDRGAIEPILAGDGDAFADYVSRTGATICGQAPIRILLRMARGSVEARLAAYDTSGRLTGSWDHSVSYAGLVFRDRPPAGGSSPWS